MSHHFIYVVPGSEPGSTSMLSRHPRTHYLDSTISYASNKRYTGSLLQTAPYTMMQSPLLFWFLETGVLCVVWSLSSFYSLGWPQILRPFCLCIPRAGIKGVRHHCLPCNHLFTNEIGDKMLICSEINIQSVNHMRMEFAATTPLFKR